MILASASTPSGYSTGVRRREGPFPETAIISITTHGEIDLNGVKGDIPNMNMIPQFTINPKIQQFYKYNAVAPGVINFILGDEDIDIRDIERSNTKKIEQLFADKVDASKINGAVRTVLQKYNDKTINETALPEILTTINTVVDEQMKGMVREKEEEKINLEKQRSQALAGKTDKATGKLITFNHDDTELLQIAAEYVNRYTNGRTIIDCISDNPQRMMVNKTYSLQKDNVSMGGEDWSISCLNFKFGRENIFDSIAGIVGSRNKDRKITLEQLVDYLAENGAKRLIVVDLTCTPFFIKDKDGKDVELIGRPVRQLRDWIQNDGMKYGGKRHNKRNTKRKGKRNIKRKRNTKRRN
jgi:hypothetical protein